MSDANNAVQYDSPWTSFSEAKDQPQQGRQIEVR